MTVSYLVWTVTLVGLTGMLLADLLIIGRRPHEPSLREATSWVIFYVALAVAFGLWVWARYGATSGGEFYTGWLVEYSLSVDNLFVFMIIMSRFAVPRQYQQKVLLVGIILALIMRAVFIATGAVLISNFRWVFYIFGLFLLYTGIRLAFHRDEQDAEHFKENALVRMARRVLPISKGYDGAKLTTTAERNGNGGVARRIFTPMLIVMIAIGTTDVVFAVDSIPAIFGITEEPFLVFTANVFALMGLRQLYFMIGGLVARLVHLTIGLAVVLGFIGVKMIIEALAENNLPFINGGEPISWAPHFPIWISLPVIVTILGITTITSLVSTARQRQRDPDPDPDPDPEPVSPEPGR